MGSFVSLKLSDFINHLLVFLHDVLLLWWYFVGILGLTFALDLYNVLLRDHCLEVAVQAMLLLQQTVIIQ